MNKIEIGLLSGAIGLVLGSIGTYIFLKKKYEDDYYWKLREAIDEECERLRNSHKKISKEETPSTDEKIFNKPNCTVEDKSPNEYYERLNEIGTGLNAGFVKGVEDGASESTEAGPHFIDEDEFRFLPSKYEIRELQYFKDDGTVLDHNDELVENPSIYISGLEEELKKMGHYQTTWILVESIGVAVEIVVLEGTYEEMFNQT